VRLCVCIGAQYACGGFVRCLDSGCVEIGFVYFRNARVALATRWEINDAWDVGLFWVITITTESDSQCAISITTTKFQMATNKRNTKEFT
jgi:hypothetical protein